MAIQVHQSKHRGNQQAIASQAITFDTNPTAGRSILIAVSNYNPTAANLIVSVTDNQGNTYLNAISNTINPFGTVLEAGIYYCFNIAASGSFTVTVNCSGGPTNYPNISGIEVSGIDTLDQIGSEDNTAGTDASPSTSGATTAGSEISVAAFAANTVSFEDISSTNGYTIFGETVGNSGAIYGAAAYSLLGTAGVETSSFDHFDADNVSVISTFKPAIPFIEPNIRVVHSALRW